MNRTILVAALLLSACGSSATTPATNEGDSAPTDRGCASWEVYCTGCNGGWFCTARCPAIACPVSEDAGAGSSSGAGGSSGANSAADASAVTDSAVIADANTLHGNPCPSGTPDHCSDCNGGGFCVAGGCPVTTCPVRDAGLEASVTVDSGTTACGTCGANQVCVRPSCGGGVSRPTCTPNDAGPGACPSGWSYSSLCSYNISGQGPGCVQPPCVPPAPFCADVPVACGGKASCACLGANICQGGGMCGAVYANGEVWCGSA